MSGHVVKFLEDEFERVRKSNHRNYLILEEVLLIKPPARLSIDFGHLGVLYLLNSNADGRVTLEELYAFAEICFEQEKLYLYELR